MKPSDIENGVEVCRLIALLTSIDLSESVEIFATDIDGLEFIGVVGINGQTGNTILECLVKAAIRRRRLVICGDFIEAEMSSRDASMATCSTRGRFVCGIGDRNVPTLFRMPRNVSSLVA